jgi:hypothetical protein
MLYDSRTLWGFIRKCFKETQEGRNEDFLRSGNEFRVALYQPLSSLATQVGTELVQSNNVPAVRFYTRRGVVMQPSMQRCGDGSD